MSAPWADLRVRLAALFRRARVERDMDDELAFHVDMEIAQNLARGMSPPEARRAALAALGGLQDTRDAYRDARGIGLVRDLLADLRYGGRWLRRSPGFTAAAVLTLALGIGGTTALYSVVDAVLLKPLPFAAPDRLMTVWSTAPQSPDPMSSSPVDVRAVQARDRAFTALAGWFSSAVNVRVPNADPERITIVRASANLFETLGLEPMIGRAFTSSEESFGRHAVLLLNHRYWQSRFGGDRAVIGRTVIVNGTPYVVIGVLPPHVVYPDPAAAAWAPMAFASDDELNTRGNYFVNMVGRLRAGQTPASATRELAAAIGALRRDDPTVKITGMQATPLHESLVQESRLRLLVLLAATALVLAIACANVAGLLFARSFGRVRELAIRASLGGTRARIVRQLLTESLLLGTIGSGVGIALAALGVALIVRFGPSDLPRLGEAAVNGRVLLVTLVLALASTLLFGLGPAWRISRVDLSLGLRDGARGTSGGGHRRLRNVLVGGQTALAVIVLAGAGLLTRSFDKVLHVDPGFRTDGLLTMSITMPPAAYPDAERLYGAGEEILTRLRAVPGVSGAAMSSSISLTNDGWTKLVSIQGQPMDPVPATQYRLVSRGYFRTMGVAVRAGRDFGADDRRDAPGVAIVNATLAARFWPDGHAIGRTIWMGPPEEQVAGIIPAGYRFPRLRIIGVVADERAAGLDRAVQPMVYQLAEQSTETSGALAFVVATAGVPTSFIPAVRRTVREFDATLPLSDLRTMHELQRLSIASRTFNTALVGVFALLALGLAAVGIYGVAAHFAVQRQRELGVRMALGASRRGVIRLAMWQGTRAAAIGAAAGLTLALMLSRFMQELLFGLAATDPLTYGITSVVLLVIGVCASVIPSVRATRTALAEVMRGE